MEGITPARTAAGPSSPPPAPPANRPKNRNSIFSRLRRQPIPYSNPSGATSVPVIPLVHQNPRSASHAGNTGSVRGMSVSAPIMLGINRSEEIFRTTTGTSNGMGLEDEVEWERVRTLPRVRLVPPEDEGEPIILYPPPHFHRPATPPPSLPHPFLSPPTSPPTSPPRRATASAPPSPPRRPTSMYTTNAAWAGMADGFILPPPKFSRGGNGGVVMPKTRQELVQDREKRMSRVWNEVVAGDRWSHMSPTSPPVTAMPLSEVEVEDSSSSVDTAKPGLVSDRPDPSRVPTAEIEIDQVENPPTITTRTPMSFPSSTSQKHDTTTISPPHVLQSEAATKGNGDEPIVVSISKTPVAKSVRKTRALSLSAGLSLSFRPPIADAAGHPPMPPPPIPAAPVIRKQKSLKKFFFNNAPAVATSSTSSPIGAEMISPLPPLPERRSSMEEAQLIQREGKARGIFSRARSKPSLRIDVKATKAATSAESAPVTPALSTGPSEATSSAYPQTPTSAHSSTPGTPRLSKRFSLSNMSNAFKKKPGTPSAAVNSTSPVPKVPELPEVYRKGRVLESAVPLSPRSNTTAHLEERSHFPAENARETSRAEVDGPSLLTPTGLPRRSESLKALERLALGEGVSSTDQLSAAAQPETPSALGLVLGPASPPILQPLGPALDLSSMQDRPPIPRPISVLSTVTISTGGCTTIDTIDPLDLEIEENEDELVHAQLMQVSPRTRRDPTVSLKQFMSSAPARTGNVVIVPRGVRLSVEAVILGPMPTFTSPGSREGALGLDNVAEESESDPDPRGRKKTALQVQLGSDLRLSAAELERRGSGDTVDSENIYTPSDEQEVYFPRTAVGDITAPAGEGSNSDEDDDLDSLPSDTVLVETPPAPPPSTTSTCNSTPTPKNRFASPEAILRRLQSSRKYQQTPYYTSASSTIPSTHERAPVHAIPTAFVIPHHIPVPPLPVPTTGVNRAKTTTKKGYSALLSAVQLRSLHFDSLDLDFGAWAGAGAGAGEASLTLSRSREEEL